MRNCWNYCTIKDGMVRAHCKCEEKYEILTKYWQELLMKTIWKTYGIIFWSNSPNSKITFIL